MELNDNKKINWTICLACSGNGKIMRGPSKKRKRRYQSELKAFNLDENGIPPKPPKKNLDICLECNGSGLIIAENIVKVDSSYPTVAIIGGGIGGVALAVACLHRGIPFTLYERDKSFDARSQGYGLTLQQASKAIQGLGIFSLDEGIISTRHVVHNSEGRVIGEWGLRKWRKNYGKKTTKRKNIHIARQSLRLSLLHQLEKHHSIKWGYKLINFSKNKNENFELNFEINGKTATATADLIVGADGIRSSVRNLLINENKSPLQYLGCIVILGICSLESLKNVKSSLFDSATVFQTVNGHERIYVMPYDNNHIMWQLSFPISESEAKSLSEKGSKVMKKEALKRLKKWHNPVPEIIINTLEVDITGYPVYDRKLLDSGLLEDFGNITLIGDAAHPMSPFKGQGANQALLDALNLARKIYNDCGQNSYWKEIGLRKTILNIFEKEMIERTTSKVTDSATAVGLLHSTAVLHDGQEPRGRGFT